MSSPDLLQEAMSKGASRVIPLFPGKGIVPNPYVRSPLFGLIQEVNQNRTPVEVSAVGMDLGMDARETEMEMLNKPYQAGGFDVLSIIYQGPFLVQADLDTLLTITMMLGEQQKCFGDKVCFESAVILRKMCKKDSGGNRRFLAESIDRLVRGRLVIKKRLSTAISGEPNAGDGKFDQQVWPVNLVTSWETDTKTRAAHRVALDPRLADLYAGNYTVIDIDQRMRLGKSEMGKYLHAYYSSLPAGCKLPVKVDTIRGLCRSTSNIYKFKQTLTRGLSLVVRQTDLLADVNIQGDKIVAKKRPKTDTRTLPLFDE